MENRTVERCPCGHGPGDLCVLGLTADGAAAAAVLRAMDNRVVAEDVRSLAESWPYLVRFGEAAGPEVCERCGTLIVAVPEALAAGGPPRKWATGAWEAAAGRKHTPRRCEWLRAPAHISLRCKLQEHWAHAPCSGTCDGHGSGRPCDQRCGCLCHSATPWPAGWPATPDPGSLIQGPLTPPA
jgi:hypothetical protein